MPSLSDLFSNFGGHAKVKLIVMGSPGFLTESMPSSQRSLNIEHVSLAELIGQEISRRTSAGSLAERANRAGTLLPDETLLAIMRRWFFARKPDAGFALMGFPATLLQAKVLDEWLEVRDESLDGVIVGPGAPASVAAHYRSLGLSCREVTVSVAAR